ncbi:MAG: hypothetical protein AB7P00_02275 [Sandaracinaceae bacterium]
MSRFGLPATCLAMSLTGCIIPHAPDYQGRPNTPAIVLGTSATPQDRILLLNLDEHGGMDLILETEIIDPDIEQTLFGLVYKDFVPELPADPDVEVPERTAVPLDQLIPIAAADDPAFPERHHQSFNVPLESLIEPDCYRLTVTVSHDYEFTRPPHPKDPVNEGWGTWIIAVSSNATPISIDQCPNVNTDQM